MREIKFRAWFNGKKKMVHNLGFDEISFMEIDDKELSEDEMPAVWDKDTIVDDSYYEGVFSYEIMQYTGLKDKNGKDIYDGDIVKHKVFGIKEITWGSNAEDGLFEDMACFMFNGTIAFLSGSEVYQIEVIGNIYENPELLEV